jgi:hypothetical protein
MRSSLTALLLAQLSAATGLAPAAAHEAAPGWSYDPWCCGGLDCQPISPDNVSITKDGFLVTLSEGEHMTARRDHERLFGFDDVRESRDQNYHACILPRTQEFRCLYVPPFGF